MHSLCFADTCFEYWQIALPHITSINCGTEVVSLYHTKRTSLTLQTNSGRWYSVDVPPWVMIQDRKLHNACNMHLLINNLDQRHFPNSLSFTVIIVKHVMLNDPQHQSVNEGKRNNDNMIMTMIT
jgi:hypothetical protein